MRPASARAEAGAGRADVRPLPVPARQPAAGERSEREDPDPEAATRRQEVVLDDAVQDRVRRLLRAEHAVPASFGEGTRLGDLRRWQLRGAERSDLAGGDQVGEGVEGLVDVGLRVRDAQLVDVDPVGPQATEGSLDRLREPPTGTAAVVRVSFELQSGLHGQHDLVPPATREGLAEDLLRLSRRVAVRGVEGIDPRVEGAVDHPHALLVITVAECPEHHGAQRELADGDPRKAEWSVLHRGLLPPPLAAVRSRHG